jgi:hypothetical protein
MYDKETNQPRRLRFVLRNNQRMPQTPVFEAKENRTSPTMKNLPHRQRAIALAKSKSRTVSAMTDEKVAELYGRWSETWAGTSWQPATNTTIAIFTGWVETRANL